MPKRVNIAAVCDAGYDDLTYVLFARDTSLKEAQRNASGKFYQNVKESVTEGLVRTIENAVKSGVWEEPDGADALKGRQLGIDYEYLMECSHLRDTELLSVGETTWDGSAAVAGRNGTLFCMVCGLAPTGGRWSACGRGAQGAAASDCAGYGCCRVRDCGAWRVSVVHRAVGVLRRKPTDWTSCSDQE